MATNLRLGNLLYLLGLPKETAGIAVHFENTNFAQLYLFDQARHLGAESIAQVKDVLGLAGTSFGVIDVGWNDRSRVYRQIKPYEHDTNHTVDGLVYALFKAHSATL